MSDETQLQVTRKDEESLPITSSAPSSLVSRGRRDAALLTTPAEDEFGEAVQEEAPPTRLKMFEFIRAHPDPTWEDYEAYRYDHLLALIDYKFSRWYRKTAERENAKAKRPRQAVAQEEEPPKRLSHDDFIQTHPERTWEDYESYRDDYTQALIDYNLSRWYRKTVERENTKGESDARLGGAPQGVQPPKRLSYDDFIRAHPGKEWRDYDAYEDEHTQALIDYKLRWGTRLKDEQTTTSAAPDLAE